MMIYMVQTELGLRLSLWDNRSYVLGSMFGGHKNAVPKLCDMVEDFSY